MTSALRSSCAKAIVRGMMLVCFFLGLSLSAGAATHVEQVTHYLERSQVADISAAPARDFAAMEMREVDLPHVVRSVGGADEHIVAWYHARIQPELQPGKTFGIYIPRARWPRAEGRFDLFVNGEHVEYSPLWNRPQLIALPRHASTDSTVDIDIALSGTANSAVAITGLWFGEIDELRNRNAWRNFFQRQAPQALSLASLVLGLCALSFWARRRNEQAYLLFGLMAVMYFIRNLHLYVLDPSSLGDWFWWLTVNSLGWTSVLAYMFATRLHGRAYGRMERILIGMTALVSILSLVCVALRVRAEIWGAAAYLIQLTASVYVTISVAVQARRGQSRPAVVLAFVLCAILVLSVHDWMLQNWRIEIDSVYLLPYGSMMLVALLLADALRRYMQAISDAEGAKTVLESRLSERTAELEASHAKLREVEREQAVLDERQRLMREMHDGLGSSLMSSLVLVEQGELDRTMVARVLRESIDDLKLTIDSLEPMDEDLLTLLGALRYRLGKRLEAAGLKLEWHVSEMPHLPWLNPTTSLQILRILQEALTNTLKHAGASIIRVETGSSATEMFVRLTDNGCGFDFAGAERNGGGRGLSNIRRRAQQLRGRVDIDSRPGATTLTLHLPR